MLMEGELFDDLCAISGICSMKHLQRDGMIDDLCAGRSGISNAVK
jgi:hypothetical protein